MKSEARYTGLDGQEFVIEYDTEDPCRICGLPVMAASVGGTDVCSWCDCGVTRNGRKWTVAETVHLIGSPKVFGRRAHHHPDHICPGMPDGEPVPWEFHFDE